jgi:hypothetical protein
MIVIRYILMLALIPLFLGGCANMNRTDQRVVSGAAIGGIFGGPFGASVGAGVGYAVDRYQTPR